MCPGFDTDHWRACGFENPAGLKNNIVRSRMSGPKESPPKAMRDWVHERNAHVLAHAEELKYLGETNPHPPWRRSEYEEMREFNRQHEKHIAENKEVFQTMMRELREHPRFLRIVSQNMHCRERSERTCGGRGLVGESYLKWKSGGDECTAGAPCFLDNQAGRAEGFAKLIIQGVAGQVRAHLVAIQELQEATARAAFEAVIASNPSYKFINDNVYETSTVYLTRLYSGLAFVYDDRKLELISQESKRFPTDYVSGANRAAVGLFRSFKGVFYARFKVRETNRYISYFNIHPSPFLTMGVTTPGLFTDVTTYSEDDLQIKKSHIYQSILIANYIRTKMTTLYTDSGKNLDYVLVGGDWNINKWLQSGVTDPKDNDIVSIRKAYYEHLEREHATLGMPNMTSVKGAALAEAKRVYTGALRDMQQKAIDAVKAMPIFSGLSSKINKELVMKSPFARSDGLTEVCFRDDVPFVPPGCDHLLPCCGSEYLTVLEVLQSVPPVLLRAIPEVDTDIVAPHGGKYTWDGMFNSVMFSPLWSAPAFQFLDHIVYNRYGLIPAYAHTMVRRYILDDFVSIDEGPMSHKCASVKYTTEKEGIDSMKSRYFNKDPAGTQVYVDPADHYAIECCLVLDNAPGYTPGSTIAKPFGMREGVVWTDSYCSGETTASSVVYAPRAAYCAPPPGKEVNYDTHKPRAATPFEWKNYLPGSAEKAIAFHQYARKLFNRMLEIETLNRLKLHADEGVMKDVMLDEGGSCLKDIRSCKLVERNVKTTPGSIRAQTLNLVTSGRKSTLAKAKLYMTKRRRLTDPSLGHSAHAPFRSLERSSGVRGFFGRGDIPNTPALLGGRSRATRKFRKHSN